MNARRPPSAPPEIPGFGYLQLLGSGGFADVFLYQQRMPRRKVAIKVLLAEALTEGARESFDAEANLMAQLSTHPSIVTIYQADIAADGRPYLAMEYCPKPNLGARYRREKISVAEALRIGIQVAGAVETSHRAGILHRDIKPANILVTEYNRPALTDFGISVALVGGEENESVGMSIPWSPPEVFAATPSSGAAADIYSLGATVYTILAGRSPFEVPGGANTGIDLIARIQSSPLSPTGRADVPASLEEVLATAMAKREDQRYSSALEFARALQKVQLELSMSVTPADVLDEQLPTDELEEEDEGHTRIRGIVTIDPTGPVTGRRPGGAAPAGPRTPQFSAPPATPPASAVPGAPIGRADAAFSAPPAAAGTGAAPGLPAAGAPGFGGSRSASAAPPEEQTLVRGAAPATTGGGVGVGGGVGAGSPAAPGTPTAAGTSGTRRAAATTPDPLLEETLHRAPAATVTEEEPTPRRRLLPYLLGAAALVVAVGIGGLVFALNGGISPAAEQTVATDKPVDEVDIGNSTVTAPTDVVGTPGADGIVFTWKNPDPQEGDSYRWSLATPGAVNQAAPVDATTVTVQPPEGGGKVCIEVAVVRSDGKGSEPTVGCTP